MVNEDLDRFTLRCPVELMIELRVMAAKNRRSVNGQLVLLLEEAVSRISKEKAGASS